MGVYCLTVMEASFVHCGQAQVQVPLAEKTIIARHWFLRAEVLEQILTGKILPEALHFHCKAERNVFFQHRRHTEEYISAHDYMSPRLKFQNGGRK